MRALLVDPSLPAVQGVDISASLGALHALLGSEELEFPENIDDLGAHCLILCRQAGRADASFEIAGRTCFGKALVLRFDAAGVELMDVTLSTSWLAARVSFRNKETVA